MRAQLTAISFGLAMAAAAFLLVWPVYTGLRTNAPRTRRYYRSTGSGSSFP
jgi:hypothetical protein